jgi:3-hydroxy-9,10-secoandrosta-1,3,5(10)-triene-9,17-dione monooxygenase reductase component
MSTVNPTELRQAFGQFATGVTVITSMDKTKNPVGVTASSFNSVSLDPPLVLWSLAKNSYSMQAFQDSGHFCVHVLAVDQQHLSQKFATQGANKFDEIAWKSGLGGVPLLPEFAARFQCQTSYQYEGGDHIIFVGEVLEYAKSEETPLVFHGGRYVLPKKTNQGVEHGHGVDPIGGTFSSEFFLYLLSRAHYQATAQLQRELRLSGLSKSDYFVLTLIGLIGPQSFQELHDRLDHTGHAPNHQALDAMSSRALLTETIDGSRFSLTVKGRQMYIELLAKSKANEEQLLAGFSRDEIADIRDFLTRFIEVSDPGIPEFWPGSGV